MADATSATSSASTRVDAPASIVAAPRRSFVKQVLHDTFRQWGARVGMVWILLLVLLGIGAPLIANSHPFVLKVDGTWSSPMWSHLTAVDLILLGGMIVFAASMLWSRGSVKVVSISVLLAIAFISPIAYAFKSPPTTVNFSQYRELERQGRAQVIVRTLIPYSPTDRLRDIPDARLSPPSWQPATKTLLHRWFPGLVDHPSEESLRKTRSLPAWTLLGTETDGADLMSRMIHASRIALSVGLISTSISILVGCLIGGVMGYFVGRVDLIGMRLIEIFEAIPTLLVLISIMAVWGRDLYLMMAVIGLLSWTGIARFIRAEFLRLREQDFVQAAVASGLQKTTIIYRHILPNAMTPVLVTATFGVASAILLEATLSFLGLGLIDEPSWGQMLNQARSGGQGFVWWMAIFPGAAIFLTVYAYALIGDAMRDALDPKLKKRD